MLIDRFVILKQVSAAVEEVILVGVVTGYFRGQFQHGADVAHDFMRLARTEIVLNVVRVEHRVKVVGQTVPKIREGHDRQAAGVAHIGH